MKELLKSVKEFLKSIDWKKIFHIITLGLFKALKKIYVSIVEYLKSLKK